MSVGLLLAVHGPLLAAQPMELSAPGPEATPPQPPPMVPDPDHPADAPGAEAIERIGNEDGSAAGLKMAEKIFDTCRQRQTNPDTTCVLSLINRANAKQRNGAIPSALNDYREAMRLAEQAGGPRDLRLFHAWNGLAFLHLAAGQVESANDAYATALHLGRVNLGLYNTEQIHTLNAKSYAELALGLEEEALYSQMQRLDIAERAFGAGSIGAAQAYLSVGKWLRQLGRLDDAISMHALAVETLYRNGEQGPELIDALIEAALSGGERPVQFDQAPLPAYARPNVNLERATELLAMQPKMTDLQRASFEMRIGDAYLIVSKRESAIQHYQKAAALLKKNGGTPPFDSPAFIRFRPPAAPRQEGPGGFLIAQFSVTDRGGVKDINLPAPGSIDVSASIRSRLRRALRDAELRPKIVNGRFIPTNGAEFRLLVRGDSS